MCQKKNKSNLWRQILLLEVAASQFGELGVRFCEVGEELLFVFGVQLHELAEIRVLNESEILDVGYACGLRERLCMPVYVFSRNVDVHVDLYDFSMMYMCISVLDADLQPCWSFSNTQTYIYAQINLKPRIHEAYSGIRSGALLVLV